MAAVPALGTNPRPRATVSPEAPSLGNLSANVAHAGPFGYPSAATETPQAITNIGYLLDRFLPPVRPEPQAGEPDREPAGAAS